MTKTCLQCGAVLPSSIRTCNFCEVASLPDHIPSAAVSSPGNPATGNGVAAVSFADSDSAWRDELALRLESYRGRKKKPASNAAQAQFSFEAAPPRAAVDPAPATAQRRSSAPVSAGAASAPVSARATSAPVSAVTTSEPELPFQLKEEFSFTIAIGRPPKRRDDDTRMIIDVSLPPEEVADLDGKSFAPPAPLDHHGLLPCASIDERRVAAVIDAACLLFAYGAFLALFSALGGEFTVSKLSGAVCVATFAIVYLQYFSLFTIFEALRRG